MISVRLVPDAATAVTHRRRFSAIAMSTSDVGEQITGHLLAFGLDRVARADLGEQGAGFGGAQVQECSAGDQVAQVPVQPVHRPASLSG